MCKGIFLDRILSITAIFSKQHKHFKKIIVPWKIKFSLSRSEVPMCNCSLLKCTLPQKTTEGIQSLAV